jgi:hypothetical protein
MDFSGSRISNDKVVAYFVIKRVDRLVLKCYTYGDESSINQLTVIIIIMIIIIIIFSVV